MRLNRTVLARWWSHGAALPVILFPVVALVFRPLDSLFFWCSVVTLVAYTVLVYSHRPSASPLPSSPPAPPEPPHYPLPVVVTIPVEKAIGHTRKPAKVLRPINGLH